MPAQKILHDAEDKMKKSHELLMREFNGVRTGRASSALVETIKVDYYGTPTPLKQLANITTPDARLIVIQPWDQNAVADIEKGILKSGLGISPVVDGKIIRLAIPELTHERREELVKIVKKMAEDQRVAIRSIRRDANEHLKKVEKDGLIAEDEGFKSQADVQKLTDRYIAKIDESLKAKEKEILAV